VAQALDRHEQRRRSGVPTVSVLVGPSGAAVQAVVTWCESLGRPLVLLRAEAFGLGMESLVVPWVERLALGHDLVDAAVAWLARRLDRPAGALGRSLRGMSRYEVDRFCDAAVPRESPRDVERVVRRLIELAAAGRRGSAPGLAPELNALLEGPGRPWVRLFAALCALVPQECLPVLVVVPAAGGPVETPLAERARLLAELAAAGPRAALALLVEPGRFEAGLAGAPDSRAKALLREGIIPVGEPGEDRPSSRPESADPTAHSQISPAASTPSLHSDPEARSAVERFFFDLLESLPETVGLFQLNATLDFASGPGRAIEVDFLASSLKLVIEIDGYYHFQDPEAYRRDRRKDLELQTRGFLVLRFLADDVVARLETVLDTTLAAVAFCRHRSDRPRGERA
jgi:hypothetical protein